MTSRLALPIWDGLAWGCALLAAAALRYEFDMSQIDLSLLGWMALVAVLAQVLIGLVTQTYGSRYSVGGADEAVSLAAAAALVGLVIFSLNVVVEPQLAPRSVPLIAVPIAILLAGAARLTVRRSRERRSRQNQGPAQRVIILGAENDGQRLLRSMLAYPVSGYIPVALLHDDPRLRNRRVSGVLVQGTQADIVSAARQSRADLLVIASKAVDGHAAPHIVRAAAEAGLGVRIVPPLEQFLQPVDVRADTTAGGGAAVSSPDLRIPDLKSGAKRALDILLCLLAMPLVLVLFAVIVVTLRLSGSDVLYRARRVGRGGKTFTMLKFATMVPGDDGPRVTREGDPRITAIGRRLRASKLNELPQVFNVLKGDMSVVGPRPEDPRYAAFYSEEQRQVFSVRPGMTCLAYLEFGDEQALIERVQPADIESYYVGELLPDKLDVELHYIRTWTVLGDLDIMARTVAGLIR